MMCCHIRSEQMLVELRQHSVEQLLSMLMPLGFQPIGSQRMHTIRALPCLIITRLISQSSSMNNAPPIQIHTVHEQVREKINYSYGFDWLLQWRLQNVFLSSCNALDYLSQQGRNTSRRRKAYSQSFHGQYKQTGFTFCELLPPEFFRP